MSSPFGFEIHNPGDLDTLRARISAYWALSLPHQCDDWVIALDTDYEKVLSEVKRFRAELDSAIAVLEES